MLSAAIFEFEHIIPLSAGGETVFKNLWFSCPTCNCYKATRQIAPDPDSNEEVSLFHPHHQKWDDHFIWNEDATKIIGLTTTGRATIFTLRMNRPQLVYVRGLWVQLGQYPP